MENEETTLTCGSEMQMAMTPDNGPKMMAVRNNIYIYDEIDTMFTRGFIPTLTELALGFVDNALENGCNIPEINIHINSNGGSLSDTFAIISTIESIQSGELCSINGIPIPIKVNTIIDSEADSGASLIACVGNKRSIKAHAVSLIHTVRTISSGMSVDKAIDMKEQAKNLQLLEDKMKSIYLKHSKLTEEQLDEIFKHELYYTPEQLKEFGLVDEIIA